MDDSLAIKVSVRVRPCEGAESWLKIDSDSNTLTLPDGEALTYDHIFDSKASQNDVFYHRMIQSIIEKFEKGYNGCIVAYGQTGSGKTYTMGSGQETGSKGIIPRLVERIFSDEAWLKSIDCTVSFIEVYMDDAYDLLSTKRMPLTIREDSVGIRLSELTVCEVRTKEDALAYLSQGIFRRTTSATSMNVKSSRSHSIFTLELKDKTKASFHCKFQLVDLAGSEAVKTSDSVQLKEGISINSSLLTLGMVIKALSEKKKYVPYRSSTLTRLLQESFGGTGLTLIIACVYPTTDNLSDSKNTLRYAAEARGIFKKPLPSLIPVSASKSSRSATSETPAKQARMMSSNFKENYRIPETPTELTKNLRRSNASLSPLVGEVEKRLESKISQLVRKEVQKHFTTNQIPQDAFSDEVISQAPDNDETIIPDNDTIVQTPIEDIVKIDNPHLSLKPEERPPLADVTAMSSTILPEYILTPKGGHRYKTMLVPDFTFGLRSKKNVSVFSQISFDQTSIVDSSSSVSYQVESNQSRAWEENINSDVKKRIKTETLRILNEGDIKKLQTLPGIGPKKAQIIFTWRQVHGSFNNLSDLKKVPGLNTNFYRTFAKINMLNHLDQ